LWPRMKRIALSMRSIGTSDLPSGLVTVLLHALKQLWNDQKRSSALREYY
jgi:hypothetical protein